MWIACPPTYCHGILIVMNRHGKMGTSGRVRLGWAGLGQLGYESNGLQVKTSHFKRIKNGFRSIGLWVRSGRVDPYFSHKFFFFYKENKLYLPLGKLCNKLLDVKCITLNSPLISRMNSVKLINTYSIILKL